MNVDELVARAREALAAAEPVTKSVLLADQMVGVRFTPVGGDEWRDLKAQHLPRPGSFMDQNLGFNVDAVTRDFPGMSIVTPDGEVDNLRRVGDDGHTRYVWGEVFSALDAPAIEMIVQALWEVHDYEPQQRMIAAGKALRAGRAKKRGSRASSASQSAN